MPTTFTHVCEVALFVFSLHPLMYVWIDDETTKVSEATLPNKKGAHLDMLKCYFTHVVCVL